MTMAKAPAAPNAMPSKRLAASTMNENMYGAISLSNHIVQCPDRQNNSGSLHIGHAHSKQSQPSVMQLSPQCLEQPQVQVGLSL